MKTFQSDKLPLCQGLFSFFARAMIEVARVSEGGAVKYHNPYYVADPIYDNPPEYYDDRVVSHLLKAQINGSVNHEDFGCLHRAHTAWNALAALEAELRQEEIE